MRKTIYRTLIMKVLYLYCAPFAIYSQSARNSTGLKDPSNSELKALQVGHTFLIKNDIKRLNAEVDLSKFIPCPGDQGEIQGSCTAFSVAYMLTLLENRKNHRTFSNFSPREDLTYSPSYIFNVCKIGGRNTDCTEGITYPQAFFSVISNGLTTLHAFPYYKNSYRSCFIDTPKQDLWRQALKVKFTSFEVLEVDLNIFKYILNQGKPIAISAKIDLAFREGGTVPHNANQPFIWSKYGNGNPEKYERHAMLCVGYSNRLKAFKILNSWG